MSAINRRQVLTTSGATLLSSGVFGQVFATVHPVNSPASGTREQLLFDFGWKFMFGHGADPSKDLGFGFGQADFSKTGNFEFAKIGFDDRSWRSLDLPHDWGVELPFIHDDAGEGDAELRSHGYKPLGRRYPETSVGWYRRKFEIAASDQGRRIWIEFDGVFRDAMIFVNGCFIGRNTHGYTPFRFDLTDFLAYGAQNVIAVRVDASFGDGWFYEGAGIYRHVWLFKTDALHLGRRDSVVRAALTGTDADLDLRTVVVNTSSTLRQARVKWTLLDNAGSIVSTAETQVQTIPPRGTAHFAVAARLTRPELWGVGEPNLYTAQVAVEADGIIYDQEAMTFGVRSAVFTADKGFFLNGQNLKIQGVCNHQDHAGVGAAIPDRLQAYRVEIMRQMGCNAIRSAHNMPTPELVDICDRMGVMVMCETRQTSSSPEGLSQLEAMVRLYRNSPSVIAWSIGNEENTLQGEMAAQGARIAHTMVALCHDLDPTRPVTAAVNADNENGASEAVDLIGFNYHREFPDAFHERHPDRPVICTEDASDVATRGEYTFDWGRNVVSSFDGDVPWKKSPENWWKFYGTRQWASGGFAWTGFDYRGEPSPFGWPSINSNFGVVDVCGFPKDYFYYYKAWWTQTPSLHVFPHWNWAGRDGQEIPVWVYSNLDEVELIVNGKSLGRQSVPLLGHVEWKTLYRPGYIEARGFKGGKRVLTQRRETTGGAAAIRLSADRSILKADGEDIAILTVEVVDQKGRALPRADTKIAFKVSGAGRLIGVGNGNPNSHESDKEPRRALFNGLAQLIVQAGKHAGDIVIEAEPEAPNRPALRPARVIIAARAVKLRPAVL